MGVTVVVDATIFRVKVMSNPPQAKKIIGLDEVGWGAIAGPMVICATYVPPEHWQTLRTWGFRDSKQLGKRLRINQSKRIRISDHLGEALAQRLEHSEEKLASWCIVPVDPITIDLVSPAAAKNKAYRRAVMTLMAANGWGMDEILVMVDGKFPAKLLPKEIEQDTVPRADAMILPVSVASIMAKSYRDPYMRKLDSLYPAFGFASNKGYPTKDHMDVILSNGPIKGVHRVHYLRKWLLRHYEREAPTAYSKSIRTLPRWLHESGFLSDGYGA